MHSLVYRYAKIKNNPKKRIVKDHGSKIVHSKLISWLLVKFYVSLFPL